MHSMLMRVYDGGIQVPWKYIVVKFSFHGSLIWMTHGSPYKTQGRHTTRDLPMGLAVRLPRKLHEASMGSTPLEVLRKSHESPT